MENKKAYRGNIFYFKDSATLDNLPKRKIDQAKCNQFVYLEDGVLVIESGKVKEVGCYKDLKSKLDNIEITDYSNQLITPGFIDTHQHATQSAIVAAYGEKLLEWLEEYVFPGESVYANPETAQKEINFFLDELLKNGTTTAVSYGPLFYEAADLFFAELNRRNMRFITGNILMDKNSPDSLRLTTQQNYDNSKKLIEKWHNKNRLSYCLSPRFALACTEELMRLCGTLKSEYPDLYIQTHLDENLSEVAEAQKEFPWSKNYFDVYYQLGLATDRTVFGHCIHLKEAELEAFKETNAIISWCPISNNFLGSGLFDLERTLKYTNNITLGTDWGGGNSLSMLEVMGDAYKVSMLKSFKLPSMLRWYMATLGAARSLKIADKVGNFTPGKEADFIVIDPNASAYMNYRRQTANDIFELLFMLMTLGNDRNIKATYVNGNAVYINK